MLTKLQLVKNQISPNSLGLAWYQLAGATGPQVQTWVSHHVFCVIQLEVTRLIGRQVQDSIWHQVWEQAYSSLQSELV